VARGDSKHRFPELVRVATRVFIAQGYRRTQMADVAAALGVAKGTLYLCVESKEALFDAVVRYADAPPEAIRPPAALPLPTPPPGATLREVEKRIAAEAALPRLVEALERRRVADVRGELEEIVRELYRVLAAHRVGIKLVDRCASDYPELASVWYRAGRGGALALLTRYLEERMRRGRLRRVGPPAVAARIVLETASFWAVHRHWDPAPEDVDEAEALETLVAFVLGALSEVT
jgi:AcrR family transcriptional regulator